ncbi:hypothetical protein ACLOJK_012518, partial [Asimina triloba]
LSPSFYARRQHQHGTGKKKEIQTRKAARARKEGEFVFEDHKFSNPLIRTVEIKLFPYTCKIGSSWLVTGLGSCLLRLMSAGSNLDARDGTLRWREVAGDTWLPDKHKIPVIKALSLFFNNI